MAHSPLGLVPFTALGRPWHLKFGNRARWKAEQLFGTGFAAIVLDCFPDMTATALADDSAEGMALAMARLGSVKIGGMAMLFGCGIVESPDEDTVDEITEELGPARLAELLAEAFTGSAPKVTEKDAGAQAGAGEQTPRS